MRRLLAALLLTTSVMLAPSATAGGREDCMTDECRAWFDAVPPSSGPSAIASINYALAEAAREGSAG